MRRGGNPDRLLATVMFTDIVSSTELATELGDRRWKYLLERHNAIVRRELKRFAGRELDTAGDGFFVMFERPAQAIDCAWAVIDAVRPLNLQIRAAVHLGEVEVIGRKVGGIAVHAASRVLGLARPGEIYVTGIVRDVVAGSDIRFADQGTHELRGVPGEWRLYAVEATSMDRALPTEPAPEPAPRRSWFPLLAVVGIAGVLLVAGVALGLASLSRPGPIVPHPNSVVRLALADGTYTALVEVEDPTEMVIDAETLWVLSVRGRTLNRVIDTSVAVIPVGLPAAPTGIAAGDGAIWMTTGYGTATGGAAGVLRVGMTTRTLEAPIPLGDGVQGIAVGEGAVWVGNRLRNTLTRIDLTTRAVAGEMEVGEQPGAVVVGAGAVWVANTIDRTLWSIDPRTMTRTSEITLADVPYDLALGFDRLWVTSSLASSVTVIDLATNSLQRTLAMPGPARGIAVGPDAVWVAIANGDVGRIDPEDPTDLRYFEVGGAPHDVAVDESGTWVSIRE